MGASLVRGPDHEDAARFSLLLATPITLAAGIYKLPDLLGPNGNGVVGQVLPGSLAAVVGAYLSVRFLARYFTTRTLVPFAVYCWWQAARCSPGSASTAEAARRCDYRVNSSRRSCAAQL